MEKIKSLKQLLYKSIDELGTLHPKTIEISRNLDIEIVKAMKGEALNE